MIYIYDILLNWTDLDLLYDFYEWDKKDTIEHVKRIPLLKVDSKTLSDFIHFKIKIDEELLDKIEDLTEVYRNKKIEVLPYACVLSDGVRCIATEFNKKGEQIFHSRLLLDEEEDVIDLVSRLEFHTITYKKGKKVLEKGFNTRSEEKKKKYLLNEISSTYQKKEKEKMEYLYQEYFNEMEEDFDLMYQRLMDSFESFNGKHENLYQLLKLSHTKGI